MSSYQGEYAFFSKHYRRDPDSLRRIPRIFPRNEWLELHLFAPPSFGPGVYAGEVAWAAQQASRCWWRCRGDFDDTYVQYDREPQPELDDVVDETCFKLAVCDKLLEMLWHTNAEQRNFRPPHQYTWQEYLDLINTLIKRVYRVSQAPPSLESIRPFLVSALEKSSTMVYIEDRPIGFHDIWKGEVSKSKGGEDPFSIRALGRFAARYYTIRGVKCLMDIDGEDEPTPEPYVFPAIRVPPELYPPTSKHRNPAGLATTPVRVHQGKRPAPSPARGDRSSPTPARAPLAVRPSAANAQPLSAKKPAPLGEQSTAANVQLPKGKVPRAPVVPPPAAGAQLLAAKKPIRHVSYASAVSGQPSEAKQAKQAKQAMHPKQAMQAKEAKEVKEAKKASQPASKKKERQPAQKNRQPSGAV